MALPDCHPGVKVSLFLDHRCNLRCAYCYNGPSFDRPMSPETVARAVDFALEQAGDRPLILAFFGGEPLLEPALIEQAIERARSRRTPGEMLKFSLATNATLLDERRLRLLSTDEMRVQVSIDGTEEAHHLRRFADGRSSWRRVADNLHRLVAAGVDLHVLAVVDPVNAHLLGDSFAFFCEAGVKRIHFSPNLAADWDAPATSRLESGLAALADSWAEALRADLLVRLDPFHGNVAAHVMTGMFTPARCAFGDRELAISPSGRIYPCDRMVKGDDDNELCLGDLVSGLNEEKRRSMVALREEVDPTCSSCDLAPRCGRSCGCANYEQTGHLGRPSPARCRWEKLVIAHADRVANQLYTDRVPAFMRRFYGRFLTELSRRRRSAAPEQPA